MEKDKRPREKKRLIKRWLDRIIENLKKKKLENMNRVKFIDDRD